MAGKGGKREGAGRKPNKINLLRKSAALEILSEQDTKREKAMTQQEYEAVEAALVDAMHKVLVKRIKTCLANPNEKLPVPYDPGMMAYRLTVRVQVFATDLPTSESKVAIHA